jgi:hypothetical protein
VKKVMESINDKNAFQRLHALISATFKSFKKLIPQFNFTIRSDASHFWRSSINSESVMDMSHWKGKGRYADQEKWDAIGKKHFVMVEEFFQFLKINKPIESMVEWGSGGGANAVKFVEKVDTFYGVDISESNLNECERQLRKIGYKEFRKIPIKINSPEKSLDFIKRPVDLFLSTAVYQHFPNKDYGRQITKIAYEMLSDDGLALIQIRYDDGKKIYKTKKRDYKKNYRVFTSYRLNEFWGICHEVGLNPIFIKLEPQVNYAFFFLRKMP